MEILPSEGYLTENKTTDGSKEIEELVSDFLSKIGNEIYLLECQSYDDESMAIRIAEYAFILIKIRILQTKVFVILTVETNSRISKKGAMWITYFCILEI